ncbi:hypothetical protein CPC08DRAFT_408400 [Agrocybe pediades]|nr:hypothetical protein CPC08DRAFT_408400 [Agrocybe pediades]
MQNRQSLSTLNLLKPTTGLGRFPITTRPRILILKLRDSSRHAQYSLGDFKAAASAFERGLQLDPSNASLKSGLQNARLRIPSDSEAPAAAATPADTRSAPGAGAGLDGMGGMADMLRNLGGGGGGMPDLASMMNNPQLMTMAQQMAQNGGLANLMRNPAISNMMNRVQSGDMPSMEEIMADPSLRSLAEQFGGGRS